MRWKKIRKFIALSLFFSVIGAVYFFVIPKMQSSIEARKKQIQEELAIQDYQQKRLGEIQSLKDDFDLAGKGEEKISAFLDKNQAVDFIQEVEKLSNETDNRSEIEVAPNEAPAKGKAAAKDTETIMGNLPAKDYLQFRIKTAGSFLGLIKFINKLENSKYYLDIVALQINVNPDAGKDPDTDNQGKTNPFAAAKQSVKPAGEQSVQNSEEVVAAINVVVYTQN